MVQGHLLETIVPQAVGAGIADMGYRYLVVMEQAGYHRGTHALALRLGLRGVVDDLVGPVDRITQDDTGTSQSGLRIAGGQILPYEGIPHQIDDGLHGDAAGDLAGVITTHAVSQDEQADVGLAADHVLVVFAHLTGIRECDAGDFPLQAHGFLTAFRIMHLNPLMAIRSVSASDNPPGLPPFGRRSRTALQDSWPGLGRSRSRHRPANPAGTLAAKGGALRRSAA